MGEVFIGKVDGCFQIKGRGCVLSFENDNSINIRVGHKIKLVTTENEIIETTVRGLEMINYRHGVQPNYNRIAFLIENTERGKQGFENGTEIYLIEEN